MFDFPISELITPEEQVAVARCVAVMASRDDDVADSERHFVEELMGQMMLLPEERDRVRKEFDAPSDLVEVAKGVKHREARIFLFYQAICAAMADNVLVDDERQALMTLAGAFEFDSETAGLFITWVQDSLVLRERGQQLLMEL
ncbi:TerB family tellurite resistance protein [Pseudenhygromyxa sp. WMMC2535]|uniref:tellurite resistance TerB family protein n=1 Tax=Pseudenhygromyxa sp. WMMC2535 TaxID=2712867 RepID=UPI0015520F0C|nr:TerB family tellurite resistance protein [Pseudenhygromyxa sp. WMMC2535]NVB40813.1 TerB family tellurite resistance protein [Pseudenhygromyxa sp. WMMC2535]